MLAAAFAYLALTFDSPSEATAGQLVANIPTRPTWQMGDLRQLPPSYSGSDIVRVLHVTDMHSSEEAARLVRQVTDIYAVDLIVNTGDETDLGTPLEARYPATYLPLTKPVIWVAGNHDSPTITNTMKGIQGVTVLESGFVNLVGLEIGGFPDPAAASLNPAPSSDAVQAVEADRIKSMITTMDDPPFIVAVHDPKQAARLPGVVPVVLNGHTHREQISLQQGTVFLDGGSTGGGGFRGFDADGEVPYTLHILFIQKQPQKLLAVDTIAIYGSSEEFSVTRRLFGAGEGEAAAGTAATSVSSAP